MVMYQIYYIVAAPSISLTGNSICQLFITRLQLKVFSYFSFFYDFCFILEYRSTPRKMASMQYGNGEIADRARKPRKRKRRCSRKSFSGPLFWMVSHRSECHIVVWPVTSAVPNTMSGCVAAPSGLCQYYSIVMFNYSL